MEHKIRLLKNNRPYLVELNFIAQKNRNIKIENTKINLTTLKVLKNNRYFYLHSKYDPLKEAENSIKNFDASSSDIIVVLGSGLGYHITKLKEKYPEKYFIICEYDINIFSIFLQFADDELLKDDKLIFLVTENKINLIDSVIRYLVYIKLKKEAKIKLYIHQASLNIYPQYREIEEKLLKSISEIYSDYLTTRELKDLWKRNIEQNIKIFDTSSKLIELKDIYKNQPLTIISAGPSLEKNLEFLHHSKMITVAVDTCLRFLVANNFYPDYVISLDAKYENYQDFKYIKGSEKIKLIYDIVTFPKIPLMFKNRYVTYTLKLIPDLEGKFIEYRDESLEGLVAKYGDFGGLQSGGSVSTNAFDFALFTGANPIYFVGLDLCDINFQSHCKGSLREYYFIQRINKFYNLHTLQTQSVLRRQIKSYVKDGNIISEEFILNKYKKWFKDAFALVSPKINVKLIN